LIGLGSRFTECSLLGKLVITVVHKHAGITLLPGHIEYHLFGKFTCVCKDKRKLSALLKTLPFPIRADGDAIDADDRVVF
jgi:hypothetical protein